MRRRRGVRVRGAGRRVRALTTCSRSARAKARLRAEIDSLQQRGRLAGRVKKSMLTDAAVQERIAREEFGMVRGDKEFLYRFTTVTDSGRGR